MGEHKIKKYLRKLTNKQLMEDIKRYIRSSHEFYSIKIPELKVLAKRLHDEHELKEFYRVFNRLWKSGYPEETSLAIHTLEIYKDEFNVDTWRFLKPKLKEIKSFDQADGIAIEIIGNILIKHPQLEKEMIAMAKSKNLFLKRIAIISTLPLIRKGEIKLALRLAEMLLHNRGGYIQRGIGWMLKEAGIQKPEVVRKFILRNINMPSGIFIIATENMKELREMRGIKSRSNLIDNLMFWR